VVAPLSPDEREADYFCDGLADQLEIQQAIDSLPSEGGTVSLLYGFFNINATIRVPSNVALIGEGSYILLDSGANCNLIENASATGNENILIQNLKLGGHKEVQAGESTGMKFSNVIRGAILDCAIEDCYTDSIQIFRGSYVDIIGNTISGSNRYGINGSDLTNSTIIGNNIKNSGTVSIFETRTRILWGKMSPITMVTWVA